MPAFEMIVLGCGGGPSEDNLSCYILKPSDASWDEGSISLEAGCGIGAISRLLKLKPHVFNKNGDGAVPSATTVYSWVRSFLITHAHLDHVNGLALSSQALSPPAVPVYAARSTLEGIQAIFSGRLWPKLASYEEGSLPLVLRPISPDGQYLTIFPNVSARLMPVSHGVSDDGGKPYTSSAFFIKHDRSGQEFLFFGDVEPDSIASNPRNLDVWRAAAPKIPEQLSTMFIECSWPSDRSDDKLYGHFNPQHLAADLGSLSTEVSRLRQERLEVEDDTGNRARKRPHRSTSEILPTVSGVLRGLRVYLIHCKDDTTGAYERPITRVIADQVRTLTDKQGLGVEIIAVEQGMKIAI